MHRRFFLFDMDGTLLHLAWDSAALRSLRREAQAVLDRRGERPPFGMMVPTLELIGREEPEVARLLDALEAEAARGARARGGLPRLLQSLQAAGDPFAIVTSNGRACAREALTTAGLAAPLPEVVSRQDVTRLKPDPEPLRRAVAALAERHGPPQQVIMVGDSSGDVEAAVALQAEAPYAVRAVGLLGGVSDQERLFAAGADLVLESLAALARHELLQRTL